MDIALTTTCPYCRTLLATEGLAIGTPIVCGSCLAQFLLGTVAQPPPRSGNVEVEGSLPSTPVTRALLPIGRNGWAIAAGYLGLFALLPVFGLLAFVAGILALRSIRRKPEQLGRGRAIFGIVMGAITSLVYGTLLVIAIARN
jgi:hypothetical protein